MAPSSLAKNGTPNRYDFDRNKDSTSPRNWAAARVQRPVPSARAARVEASSLRWQRKISPCHHPVNRVRRRRLFELANMSAALKRQCHHPVNRARRRRRLTECRTPHGETPTHFTNSADQAAFYTVTGPPSDRTAFIIHAVARPTSYDVARTVRSMIACHVNAPFETQRPV